MRKNDPSPVAVEFSLFKNGTRIENPTMAANDFTVAIDGGAQNNVNTLPTSDGAGLESWQPIQAETNGDIVTFLARDVLGDEWEPLTISWDTRTDTTIWTYLDAAISGLPSLAAIVAGISAILCNVWSCARRTLTMPITQVKSMLLGTKLEILRGDTFDQPFTALGDLTTTTELWFTVKKQLSDADAASEIQISLTGGLLAIAGDVATAPANGSITIVDAATGHITVYLEAEEAAKLDVDFAGYWDIQKAVGDVVTTLTRGNSQVLGDATRSVA